MRKLVKISVIVVFWLCTLEVLTRILFPLPEIDSFNRIKYSPLLPQATNAEPLMNAAYTWASLPDNAKFVLNLNLNGFRDSDWKVRKDVEKRIAIVGDSFVEGFMAEDHQTIPYMFSKNCTARELDVQVMNLGVGAAGIREYYKLIADFIPIYKPDEVILVLYQNDILPDLTFESSWLRSENNIQFNNIWFPRIVKIGRAFFDGRPIPRAWHSKPLPFWPRDLSRPVPGFVPPRFADAIRQGGFNENQPWMLLTREESLKRPIDIIKWRNGLRMLAEFMASHNTRLSLVYLPSNTQVSDYYLPYFLEYSMPISSPSMTSPEFQFHAAQLSKLSAELGIPWLDLTPSFRAAEAQGQHLYWNYDEHMRATGYEFTAAVIFDWWQSVESMPERLPNNELK